MDKKNKLWVDILYKVKAVVLNVWKSWIFDGTIIRAFLKQTQTTGPKSSSHTACLTVQLLSIPGLGNRTYKYVDKPVVIMMLVQVIWSSAVILYCSCLLVARATTIEFMNFCNLFALPDIPFSRTHRALLLVLVRSSLLSETDFYLRSPSPLKWENKLGASHMTSGSYQVLQGDMISTTAFPIASWCLELYCQTDGLDPLSQAERSLAYISVLDINDGQSWLIASQLGE